MSKLTEDEREKLIHHIGAWRWESRGLARCEEHFIAEVEAILTARLARVEALVAPVEGLECPPALFDAMYGQATDPDGVLGLSVIAAANAIRAALAAAPSHTARLARVEALADEWERDPNPRAAWLPIDFANELRTAFAAAPLLTTGALPWGEMPYGGRTPREVVDDYVLVRGDLSAEYARAQLARWIDRYAAAVRDEAAREAGRAHAAFALECAAEDFEVEQRAKARAEGALHPWSEAVTFLAARAAALRAAPPTEAPREGNA